jgi:hypothetical protein
MLMTEKLIAHMLDVSGGIAPQSGAMESLAVASAMNSGFGDADAVRRSENNILKWMKYLPEDCITRMIEMEWDITT